MDRLGIAFIMALALGCFVACGDDVSATGAGGSGGGGEGGEGGAGATGIGGTPAEGGGGAASCGPTFVAGETCIACAENSCCDLMQGCGEDPVCEGLAACFSACEVTDHACVQACVASLPSGTLVPGVWFELRACMRESCVDECSLDELTCGGSATTDPTCDACQTDACCDETAARNAEPDWFSYQACLVDCNGLSLDQYSACSAACIDAHPAGVAVADVQTSCAGNECWEVCGGSCAGPAIITQGDCDTCMSTSCCEQGLGCGTHAECALEGKNCVLSCPDGDPACMQACADAVPSVVGELGAYFVCAASQCQAQCFPNLVAQCGNAAAFEEPACKTCIETSCCDTAATCGQDAACFALMYCIETCEDAACATQCKADHPEASSAYASLDTCRTTTCQPDCGF